MLVFPVNDNRRNITGSPSLLENGTGVGGQEKYYDLGSGDRRTTEKMWTVFQCGYLYEKLSLHFWIN